MSNTSARRKKNKDKNEFSSIDHKVPKARKRKDDVMDMSVDIIDIDNTPDVATWNKEIHIKGDAAGITDNRSYGAEILQPRTLSIGLTEKRGPRKDLIIDPADNKEVDQAIKSESTLTDEADLS
jgi:hypothetical protein